MIDTIFFDLDGTLLPMDQDHFVEEYFQRLTHALVKLGYDAKLCMHGIAEATKQMMLNKGPHLNEALFWKHFTELTNIDKADVEVDIHEFYVNDFQNVIKTTQPIDDIQGTIDVIKDKGYQLVLATNPLFPEIATYSRIKWANLNRDSFTEITTYENYHASKPHLEYYQEILKKVDREAHHVLMVGNDVSEDLSIAKLGAKTYLVTDNLINHHELEIESDYVGTMAEFRAFAENLPTL